MIQDLKLPVVFTELPIKVYPSRISKISECVCARVCVCVPEENLKAIPQYCPPWF